jgi:ribonuclease HII
MSIAAASVLAKTSRDEYMNRIHEEHLCTIGKEQRLSHERAPRSRKYGTTNTTE